MPLSDQEIKHLLEKAEAYSENDFIQALNCYNQLIENTPPNPHYFLNRAKIGECLNDLIHAINDVDKAIELAPDNARHYWYRGELMLRKYGDFITDDISEKEKKPWIEEIIGKIATDYKAALERNPSDSKIWLSLLIFNILLHNWDDAISIYGSCRPFIDTKENQLIRSWLGCIALVLAGDPIEEEDKNPLYDKTIRRSIRSFLSLDRITSTSFIGGIKKVGICTKEKWGKLIEIYELFHKHCYGGENVIIERIGDMYGIIGDMLQEDGHYEESLEAYDREIEYKPYTVGIWIWGKKGDVLRKLKRWEEAIKAYDKVMAYCQNPDELNRENLGKADCLFKLGRYEEALQVYDKIKETNHIYYTLKIWRKKSRTLEALGKYDKALKVYDEDGGKGGYEEWYFKGNLFKRLNVYDEAIKAFDKAIEVNPNYYYYGYTVADAWYGKASTYSLKNDRENTIASLSKAIELNPKYKEDAKQDEVFKNLWDDEDFKRIVG